MQITNSIIKLCFTVNLNKSDSFPTRPTAAAPIAIDCGEIIFPVTPPEAFALTVTTGSTPRASADVDFNLQNKALEDVSDPVRNTPSHPRMGEKKGNRAPVPASAIAMVIDIPELFAMKANPTIDAIVITGNFNCFKVDQKISAPCRYVTPSNGIEITVANTTAVPGADK